MTAKILRPQFPDRHDRRPEWQRTKGDVVGSIIEQIKAGTLGAPDARALGMRDFMLEAFGGQLRPWQEEALKLIESGAYRGAFTAGRMPGKTRFKFAAYVHSLPISDDEKRAMLRELFPED